LSNISTNQSFLDISGGGEMRFSGTGNVYSGINTAANGGNARITVSGAGSKIQVNGESGLPQSGHVVSTVYGSFTTLPDHMPARATKGPLRGPYRAHLQWTPAKGSRGANASVSAPPRW